ncbi:unnamed protein product [Rotaria sp. Silwood1]|nr:unnamed protein product [Rotaria sp. Silwood1]
MLTVTTLGVDTKPLLAGIGITGFYYCKPFVRECRIKIHGSAGGIEGLVYLIDVRYVHLKTKDLKSG